MSSSDQKASPDTFPDNPFSSAEICDKARTILQAARTVFFAHGFSAASTDMIQREAGVSKSTVYAYYPGKEALFSAVIKAECAAFLANVRIIKFRSGNLRDTLTALAKAYLTITLSPSAQALFRVVIAEAPRFPELAQIFYQAGPQAMTTAVAEHLARAIDSGEVDLNEPGREAAASLFLNLVRGDPLFLQSLTHPTLVPSAAQIDHWANLAVTTFLRAYGRSAAREAGEV
jgi:AcrR family transcriptional regulator